MKKLYFLAAFSAAILSLSSCSDKSDDPNAAHGNRIDFTTYVNATRGVTSDLSTLQQDGFTLWAAQNTGAAYNATTDKVGFLYEEPVHYEAGQHYWAYDNIKFWPENGAISFFAVAPASQFGAALQSTHSKGDAGAPVVTYQMPVAQDNQVDIIAAQSLDRAADGNKVVFNFKHMLSKLDFSVRMPELDGVAIHLRKVELYYKNNAVSSKCAIDLNDMTSTVASDDVPFTSGAADDVLAASLYDGDKVVTTTATRIAETADKFLLVVPQTYASGDLYAKVSYTINVTDPALASTTFENVVDDKVINLPVVAGGWLQGKSYKYAMNLGTDHMTFDTHVEVLPWDSEEEIPFNQEPETPFSDGISYDSATQTYHVWTAEGIAVLDDVWDGTNTISFKGCEENFQQRVDKDSQGYYTDSISLDANIDMSDINDWKPMTLNQSFNGNNYTLSNLTITADTAALFKQIENENNNRVYINDLTLKNFNVHGTTQAAQLVGSASYTNIKHCFCIDDSYKTGHVAVESENEAGGLAAYMDQCTAYYCGVETNVNSTTGEAGTFVDNPYYSKFVGCYSKALTVPRTDNTFVFSRNYANLKDDYIYSCIQIYGEVSTDYIWEQFNNTMTTYDHHPFEESLLGKYYFSYGGYDYVTSVKDHTPYMNVGLKRLLNTPEYYFSMTSGDVKLIPAEDISAPFSRGIWYDASTQTYHVDTAEGMAILNDVWKGTNTIAFDGCSENFQQRVNPTEDKIALEYSIDMTGINWEPLVLVNDFDGNNNAINHLNVNADSAALFKRVGSEDGRRIHISDLRLQRFTIHGTSQAATLATSITNTEVNHCEYYSNYTTENSVQSEGLAGGLIAYAENSAILYCGARTNVISTTGEAGGIAGTISNCVLAGVYSKAYTISRTDNSYVFIYSGSLGHAYGCMQVYGASSADYIWSAFNNDPMQQDQKGCYGGFDYNASIYPNRSKINTALDNHPDIGTPKYYFGSGTEDMNFIANPNY